MKKPGRPRLYETPTVCTTIRITKRQRQRLKALGGGKWVRAKIEETYSDKSKTDVSDENTACADTVIV